MAITDLITISLSFFFLTRGASRGFMNSLINPFSIIMTTILSIFYYQITGNMIMSLIIGTVGPLLLTFFLRFLLKTWIKATKNDVKPGFLSRLGGAILTLTWGWVFIIFTLILLAVLPPLGKTLTDVHSDVMRSASYCYAAKPLEDIFYAPSKQNVPLTANSSSAADAGSLAQDPRFQKILQDPEIQNDINAHDIVKLMSNPKMIALTQAIMSDPATMKKVMAVYRSQTTDHLNTK